MTGSKNGGGVFGALGRAQASAPLVFIATGLGFACILAGTGIPGIGWKKTESELWVQSGGRLGNELDWLASDDIDGTVRVDNELVMTANGGGRDGDVLNADALASHLEGTKIVWETTVSYNEDTYNFADFCSYSFGPAYASPCTRVTALDCFKQGDWDYPAPESGFPLPSNYAARPDFTTLSPTEIKAVVDNGCFMFDMGLPLGKGGMGIPAISIDNIIGGRITKTNETDCKDKKLTKAQGLQTAYRSIRDGAFVNRMKGLADEDSCKKLATGALRMGGKGLPKNPPTKEDAKAIRKMLNEKIEAAVFEASKKYQSDKKSASLTGMYMSNSLLGEMDRQASVNRIPLLGGYLVMIIYVVLSLASWKCDFVQSRAGAGLAAVATVGAGLAGGIGLAGLCGIDMNFTAQAVLPLVLLGIGIDDVFVMCFNFAPPAGGDAVLGDVMADFVAEVGPSVTLTSITNMVIFAIASMIPIPLVSDFSGMASICVFMIYLMVLFVYPAFLALDYSRRIAGRADILCCIKPSSKTHQNKGDDVDMLKRCVDDYYAPAITSVPGGVFALVLCVALVATAGSKIKDVELDLNLQDVIDTGSVIRDAVEVRFMHFDQYGFDLVTRDISIDTVDMQHRVVAAHQRLTATEKVMRNYYPHILFPFFGWAKPGGTSEGSKLGCTFGLYNPPADLPENGLSVKTLPGAEVATNPAQCTDRDEDLIQDYRLCWGKGHPDLKAMKDGVDAATYAGFLQGGLAGVLAEARKSALAAVKEQTYAAVLGMVGGDEASLFQMPAAALAALGGDAKKALVEQISESALLANTMMASSGGALTIQSAPAAVAALSTADKAAMLDGISESALLANALFGAGLAASPTAGMAMAATLPAANKTMILDRVADDALVANALVGAGLAASPTAGMAMAPTLPAAQRKKMLDATAMVGLVASFLAPSAGGMDKALAQAGKMTPAALEAVVKGAITGPTWGTTDETWCMGMSKEPITTAQMFDQTTLKNHPNALGATLGFQKCFDLFVEKDATAKSVFQGEFFRPESATCDSTAEATKLAYPMKVSKMPMMSINLKKGSDFVQLIKESRKALHVLDKKLLGNPSDVSDGDLFPSGVPFVFWEQYVTLIDELTEKLGYALAVAIATVTTLLFALSPAKDAGTRLLVSVWGSLIVITLCIITVVEVYGFMGIVGIKLNAIPQVTLIMTLGIAVEFTAHTVLAFINAPAPSQGGYLETRKQRTMEALNKMAVPTLHGSITTFLGIVMISLSKSKFIVLYYFVLYAFIVLFGFINGLIVLPAMLVFVGPPASSEVAVSNAPGKQDPIQTGVLIKQAHVEEALAKA